MAKKSLKIFIKIMNLAMPKIIASLSGHTQNYPPLTQAFIKLLSKTVSLRSI